MDPRRVPELSDAAARGAARKAAADARQRSIQQAMMRTQGKRSCDWVKVAEHCRLVLTLCSAWCRTNSGS